MEGLEEKIIDELKEKAIERSDEMDITENTIDESAPVKEVKKSKKVRSEKQKAAFEKARKTRAENLKIKKQLDAEKKEQKKKEKELVKKQVKERLENSSIEINKETEEENPNMIYENPKPSQRVKFNEDQDRFGYREQVVNNYYYYGHHHQDVEEPPPRKKARKKKIVSPKYRPEPEPQSETESEVSDVSEIDEPETYRELQQHQDDYNRMPVDEPEEPKFKFRFA